MKVDILIRNGLVMDPYRNIQEIGTVAIQENKIVEAPTDTEAAQVIDATGCIVSPGLVDFHGHFADTTSDLGANAEMICFPTGVTTIVDAGTTGVANYLGYRVRSMQSQLQSFALLHINPSGIATIAYPENMDPRYCDDDKMKMFMEQYRDQLIGLKVRQSKNIVGDLGLEPLRHLRKLADEIGCMLVAHTTNPPGPVSELLELLKPGDVFCHVFQGKGVTIIGPDGKVDPAVVKAQKRGVIFDAANGKNNFGFKVAEAALADGFLPDVISTDMSAFNAYNRARVFSLPFVMSKYLMLGMDIGEVYRCVILNPAKALGQEKELGSLLPGTVANVTVHRLINKTTYFEDCFGESRYGEQVLRTEMTVNQGTIVFRTIDI